MEKISWKKELYFVIYSISKFRDFSEIFLKFLWNFSKFFKDFSDFEHIYENATLIFKVKIYINALRFSKSEIYRNVTPIFKVKNNRNAPLIYRIFEVRYLQKCHFALSQSKTMISLN